MSAINCSRLLHNLSLWFAPPQPDLQKIEALKVSVLDKPTDRLGRHIAIGDCNELESLGSLLHLPFRPGCNFSAIEKLEITNCPFLKETDALNNISSLCSAKFMNCDKIKTVALIDETKRLQNLIFEDCTGLESFSITQKGERNQQILLTLRRSTSLHSLKIEHAGVKWLNLEECPNLTNQALRDLFTSKHLNLFQLNITGCPQIRANTLSYIAAVHPTLKIVNDIVKEDREERKGWLLV